MNELIKRFESKGLSVLAFPCNQFGHKENCNNDEILKMLKYVRPGDNYKPKFDMMAKIEVNGSNAHPLFKYLKEQLPYPSDDRTPLMENKRFIIWNPVERNDISWNFNKFLVGRDGKPVKRYSKKFLPKDIAEDVEEQLEKSSGILY